MIQWLVQSMADLAGASGQNPWLTAEEAATYAKLNNPKRRDDWLLGRWTAKHLVRSYLQTQHSEVWPLDCIGIGVAASGAPFVRLDLPGRGAQSSQSFDRAFPEELTNSLSLSISHSAGMAFCALTDQAGCRLGADIEHVEPREMSFVADFFTAAEMQSIAHAPETLRASLVTAIWSGKEAVLKGIREGLRSDTRSVECIIEPLPLPVDQWQPFTIRTDAVREPMFATLTPWQGWWRSYQESILTMAVGGRL